MSITKRDTMGRLFIKRRDPVTGRPTWMPLEESTDHGKVIDLLLALAYATYRALDDSEEIEDGKHVIDTDNTKAVCDALDALDALPDDQPGYTMGPAAKARWALRSLIGTGEKAVLPTEIGK